MRQFNIIILFCFLFIILKPGPVISADDNILDNDPDRILYGNVYGSIIEASSGNPLNGAHIYLTDESVRFETKKTAASVSSNRGWVVLPERDAMVCSAVSRSDGAYIINNIRLSGSGSRYSVIIEADGMAPVIINSALILPGAIMALQVDVQMGNNTQAHIVDAGRTSPIVVTNNYRHELSRSGEADAVGSDPEQVLALDAEDALTLRVYATREGLVGGTTANGHVIQERDHFVALPSSRVLCSKNGYEYQVRLEHNGYTETVPVWDIGPWNIHDNYWDSEKDRLIYQYLNAGGQHGGLGQGLPESQAAYEDDFNSGQDEFDRQVKNPAGIDLADGTFWDGLNLSDNAWISVKYLWQEGDGDGDNGGGGGGGGCFIRTAADCKIKK